MRRHVFSLLVGLLVAAAILAVAPIRAAGQGPTRPANGWTPPRTADGKPDLQGFWRFSEYPDGTPGGDGVAASVEAYAPKTFRAGAPSLVIDPPDGKIPYQPWAAAKRREYVDEDHVYVGAVDPHVHCFRNAPPRSNYAPNGLQILQIPGSVIILGEYSHNYRVVPTDGRPHIDKDISLWIGDSRGHWEGDTLVVDVANLNGKPWLASVGDFTSPTLHLVERWTLINAETIYYEATLDDPNLYTRPWKMAFRMARRKEPGYELMEFACFEGERSLKHILDVTPGAK